jgi:outer membrane protein TolC
MNGAIVNLIHRSGRGCLRIVLTVVGGLVVTGSVQSVELTLEDALMRAVNRTSRGSIIEGRRQVAEQNYRARRTNFYFPEISINGALPAYNEDQSYRFFGGFDQKQLIATTDLGFRSFIEAKQSLITGGDLTITANLTANDEKYPTQRFFPITDSTGVTRLVDVTENSRQGFFEFSLNQPILKPSDAKHDLHNKHDDLKLAELKKVEDEAALRQQVIEAYMGVVRLSLAEKLAQDKLRSAQLKAEIDSAKFSDGIISEEEYLASRSAYLDAELARFEAETDAGEQRRQLAMLLDIDPDEELITEAPDLNEEFDERTGQAYIDNWEYSLTIQRAKFQFAKAERQANYTASSHGLNGDLAVNYSFGRGTIETDGAPDNDINTNSWGVSLNFSYPIWDGGASSSSVQAARLEAEQSRLEYVAAEKSAKAEVINIVNRLNVSFRRLGIVRQQIQLAENRLNIASSRKDDGQISELTFLESRISYLEARDKFFEELKQFLLSKSELQGMFIG